MTKQNLLGMTWPALTDFFDELGQPQWRAQQLMEWVYKHNVADFQQMTNFPKDLRQQLAEIAVIGVGEVIERQTANDGTMKLAIQFPGDRIVECVILQYFHGVTLCLSSQLGCKMGCAFCASGLGGFEDNLTTSEIIEQIWLANQELAPMDSRVGNLVYMGMGEPLDNYGAVVDSIRLANSPYCFNIGGRNITVSTSGLVPGIRQLAQENMPLTLSVSLHAPVDYLRDQIMPINRRYPVSELVAAARYYAQTTRRRVTFEYILLAGFNDQRVHAEQLADLVGGMLANVNLIPYNEVPGLPWQSPTAKQIESFQAILQKKGVAVTVRRELGPEIEAACGQLRRRLRR